MSHETKMSKSDERREMQKLMEERDKRPPDRPEPSWILNFWATRRSITT